MRKGFLRSFRSDESGAVAPLYALMLFGLIGIGGVGFDYGRMMAMDSELQSAADAAALAAATQLNGQSDAMNVAMAAANNAFATAASAFVNETRLSNVDDDGDGDTRPITQLTFTFYSGYDYDTDNGGAGEGPTGLLDPATDDGEDATVVVVTVNGRELFYALTPVVGAISSGEIAASATATLQQGTCDVVPMMFCAPNPSFGTESDIGKGMRLHMLPNATDAFTPGNFGFLDIEYGTSGNPNRRLGINTQGGVCVSGVVESDPGDRAAEVPPFNTRFDRYENSASGLNCNGAGDFCAAQNVRKNYVQRQERNTNASTPTLPCEATPTNNDPWEDRPDGGYPKESCIAAGTCNFGDGVTAADWTPYMNRNHGGASADTVPAAASVATRWEMYQWERDGSHMAPVKVASTSTPRLNGQGNLIGYQVTNYCSYPTPKAANVFTPDPALNQKDRRVLTVAAVDCTGLNGRDAVKILRWVDIFLVDSANTSGSDKEFMAEVIGPAKPPGGDSGFQTFGRGKAVLIR
jgi:Flp pilus assembly protein TadG